MFNLASLPRCAVRVKLKKFSGCCAAPSLDLLANSFEFRLRGQAVTAPSPVTGNM